MKLSKSDGRGTAFGAVYEKLASSSTAISKTWLMSAFEVDKDPCNRGDTVKEGDVWKNNGSACRLSASVSIFNNKQLLLAINVPPKLAFRVTKSGQAMILSPASPIATLVFNDTDLQKDWGGGILEVRGYPDRVQFQLPKGCIQIPSK